MNLSAALDPVDPVSVAGRVVQAVGIVIEGYGSATTVGELCEISTEHGEQPVAAEVVGFRGDRILLMPLGEMRGIGPGSLITMTGRVPSVPVGPGLLGRILDGLGRPLDDQGDFRTTERYPLYAAPPSPLRRARIRAPLDLGIRAINGFLTCGQGQKMGIFSGAGVGKSVLLGMISRYTKADVNVIALIGERGREVKEFLERDLGDEALRRSVVVVATSDQAPLVRLRAALVATAVAEYFRDAGKQVLLLMDSLTRLAYSQREVGLAIGEPPTTKGYTPSVFALLPKLLERVGTGPGPGAITGLYTVLVDGDDLTDPVADAARSILDGHIVLSRTLAARNHFPAIDLLQSTSRVMRDIVGREHREAAGSLLELVARYRQSEDLILVGAYKEGVNKALDRAVRAQDSINAYLRQDIDQPAALPSSVEDLIGLAKRVS
ncbi:FliI/YscN family ATPase [Candidatus Nitrospira inopinata]|jgi:flagellum-specific ATP synthase|uniref:Flagellum-specific ATP synthase n=1 Tax=Candidatus Nitrospira inopinata TaxID=1715989 RepID=A0A0S4KVD9_9BACT|nr:FliI/YscN family ATPase [Candidatus Nitrospira inopinata]CUQ67102.1 flagellum-specific ATP synthase [Candidatus Nitrospira inopinata]